MRDRLHRLFASAEAYDASDLHLCHGGAPMFRIGGRLVPTQDDTLDDEPIRDRLAVTLAVRAQRHDDDRD